MNERTPEYQLRPSDPPRATELARSCGVGPFVGQVLLHRGIKDVASARAFLAAKLSGLTSPESMADRDAAADRIADAIRRRERVVVFGDYDVDGTTSAALLTDVLTALGGDARALVANRFDGGYGFSSAALQRCMDHRPGLIVTCDCGSSDHERIASAQAKGVDVIVVDHHLVPKERLPAYAFLNPHRPDCGFAYKGLASAGLVLSLGAAVRTRLGVTLDLRSWLDLVALGTVADVAPLDGDNRRLVRAGLQRISSPHARPGVTALCELARISVGSPVSATDIAFRIAPRMNAAGRLGDPSIVVELLRARDIHQARGLAARIEQINERRKSIERRVTAAAIKQVEDIYGNMPAGGVVVAAEDWHRGVVGITAARLVDRFQVPAAVLAFQEGLGHGSGRAPEGFDLFRAISHCREHLTKFGGHHAAVGFSLSEPQLEAFRAAFTDACKDQSAFSSKEEPRLVDAEIDGVGLMLPAVSDLISLEPVGERFREPTVALVDAKVVSTRVVGDNHLSLELQAGGGSLRAFAFELGHLSSTLPSTITPIGSLRPDNYRGGGAVELRVDVLNARVGAYRDGIEDPDTSHHDV
ncbi:MAG: single-stranded-DNA-specific exonuclease RecJ [Myxococcota bacterium]